MSADGELLLGRHAVEYGRKHGRWPVINHLKVLAAGMVDEEFQDPEMEDRARGLLERVGLDTDPPEFDLLAACLLAHLIREAEGAIQSELREQGMKPDVIVNICMPVEYIEKNVVCDHFLRIFAWAEAIWKRPRQLEKAKKTEWKSIAQSVVEGADYGREPAGTLYRKDPTARVFGCPESIAQCAAYQNGSDTKPGVTAIVDIGAGTTDVSIGRLVRQGGSFHSYWYAARNVIGGSRPIEKEVEAWVQRNPECVSPSVEVSEVLIDIREHLQNGAGDELQHAIRRAMEKVRGKSGVAWKDAFKHEKRESHWTECRILLSGASAFLPDIQQTWSVPWSPRLQDRDVTYDVYLLDRPRDMVGLKTSKEFARLGVAYGLAHPLPELASFTLPKDLADGELPPQPLVEFDMETGKLIDRTTGEEVRHSDHCPFVAVLTTVVDE